MKKIFLIIIMFVTSCGYQPLYVGIDAENTVFNKISLKGNKNINVVKNVGSIISTNYYSTEYSDDLIGVEVCAATKNIYSMLIGASEGLSGENLDDKIKKKILLKHSRFINLQIIIRNEKVDKKTKRQRGNSFRTSWIR